MSAARAVMPADGMNRSERLYAARLEAERTAGVIRWWKREPLSLRLGPQTVYRPDFLVVNAAGEIECHEVKGSAGGANFHARGFHHPHRDSWAKLKIAAEQFPFRFVLAWRAKGGEWESKVITREES